MHHLVKRFDAAADHFTLVDLQLLGYSLHDVVMLLRERECYWCYFTHNLS